MCFAESIVQTKLNLEKKGVDDGIEVMHFNFNFQSHLFQFKIACIWLIYISMS